MFDGELLLEYHRSLRDRITVSLGDGDFLQFFSRKASLNLRALPSRREVTSL